MNETASNVEPAAGLVIPCSAWKILCVLGFLLAGLFGGIVLIWSWWTQTELPLPLFGERGTRWNGMSGLLLASMSALMIPLLIGYSLAREKLIIARDRLQIVHKSGGSDQVVAQFPYRNVAKIFRGDDGGVRFIGIVLENPADPETFALGWNFPTTDISDGWHYKIGDGYQRELDEILELILDRLHAHQHT
jgi:hypothetical protein